VANVMISSSGQRLPSGARRRPPLVLRRLRRTKAKKLLQALRVIQNEDRNEALRAETHNYTPFLIRGEEGSTYDRAIRTLISRLNAGLAQRGN